MAKLSKRAKAIKAKVDRTKTYPFDNAVALIKELATAKFNESIDPVPTHDLRSQQIRRQRTCVLGFHQRTEPKHHHCRTVTSGLGLFWVFDL